MAFGSVQGLSGAPESVSGGGGPERSSPTSRLRVREVLATALPPPSRLPRAAATASLARGGPALPPPLPRPPSCPPSAAAGRRAAPRPRTSPRATHRGRRRARRGPPPEAPRRAAPRLRARAPPPCPAPPDGRR